ncbi:MAG: hypothetical protein LBO09_03530 [Candidatus Peribacteria bacterium]|jgi:hypothetical protein|nr:hypothetical protein [Candidatus Peribacteria bacterium]
MENTYDALLLSGSLLEKSLEINLDHGNDIENVYERSQLQKNTRLIVTNSDDRLANA